MMDGAEDPAAGETRAGTAAAPAETLPQPSARRILVVDDNVDAAESMAFLLQVYGHETRVAYEPQSALEQLRGFAPNFVLLDIGLPGMSGYELAAVMRPIVGPGTIMIALTGYGQDEDRQRARDAGFDHHLTKPVDIDHLTKLVA
jgi:CheY-like chemotaxis protein